MRMVPLRRLLALALPSGDFALTRATISSSQADPVLFLLTKPVREPQFALHCPGQTRITPLTNTPSPLPSSLTCSPSLPQAISHRILALVVLIVLKVEGELASCISVKLHNIPIHRDDRESTATVRYNVGAKVMNVKASVRVGYLRVESECSWTRTAIWIHFSPCIHKLPVRADRALPEVPYSELH